MPQGLRGPLGIHRQQVFGDPGLHVDHRDLVGHHVVQLAGDPQPFLGHPALRLLLTGLLGHPGPLARLGQGQALLPH